MAIRFLDEQPQKKSTIRFIDEQPEKPTKSLGQAAIEDVKGIWQGLRTPIDEIAKNVYQAGKEGTLIPALTESYRDPTKSFKEAPISTALDWASLALPILKGGKILTGLAKKAVTTPVKAKLVKALNLPKATFAESFKNLEEVIPEIHKTALENGIKITSKATFDDAIIKAQENIIASIPEAKGVRISGDMIGKKMLEPLTGQFIENNPGKASKILQEADYYRGKTFTIDQLTKMRIQKNAELKNFYSQTPADRTLDLNVPQYKYKVNEVNAIRDSIYDTLKGGSREKMKKWGALQDIYESSMGQEKQAYITSKSAKAPIMKVPGVEKATKAIGKLPFNIQVKDVLSQNVAIDDLIKSAFQSYNDELNMFRIKNPKLVGTLAGLETSTVPKKTQEIEPLMAKIKDIARIKR